MTIEKLQTDMIVALKEHNKFKKDVLSGLIASIKKTAIDKKCKDNITESFVDEILIKELKTVKEMIDTCPKERTELMNEYLERYKIVEEYTPTLMTDETEIKNKISEIIESLPEADNMRQIHFPMILDILQTLVLWHIPTTIHMIQ